LRIISAARPPIMIVGAFVGPEVTVGITEASATRSRGALAREAGYRRRHPHRRPSGRCDGVTKLPPGSREILHVFHVFAPVPDHLCFASSVERPLVPSSRDLDRLDDRREILRRAEVIGLDDRCVLPFALARRTRPRLVG